MSDGLVDLLDRLFDTGVAAGGDVTLSVAGVELIQLRLQALLASIGTEGAESLAFAPRTKRALPSRIDATEQSLERGLAQLVLMVVEILGELLERQAVRRLAAGTLTSDESRRLGDAFTALHARVEELTERLTSDPPAAGRSVEAADVLAPLAE